ncbi:predicted protein [Aspergillus terreus NIH2624]|uniref:Uncharacterized protein n=1 Tax=Aspergillus terreus (strain NIH 2624 / FGSC A1156) TaxID=341663 RepID=Q0CJ97_ASPTN|nr:uncharacterized protein ATEG_06237 [Aspergillus terreus NIH2624]EAU33998.1 predicted protein [Aspergillus terreus NIH2624]
MVLSLSLSLPIRCILQEFAINRDIITSNGCSKSDSGNPELGNETFWTEIIFPLKISTPIQSLMDINTFPNPAEEAVQDIPNDTDSQVLAQYTYPSYHENLDITRSGLSGISHYNEVLNSLEDNVMIPKGLQMDIFGQSSLRLVHDGWFNPRTMVVSED